MGYLKYVKDLWKKPKANMPEAYKDRIIAIRKEPVTVRLERPTRIDRARSLGYRAKQGIFVVRQRVIRGGHTRPDIKKGRRTKHSGQTKNLSKNYQSIAEERVQRKYHNCEILNSYSLMKDGRHYWFEVIVVDRSHPAIKKDKQLAWIATSKKRVLRGKTSAGKKARGLRNKGKGAEKVRPSMRAHNRRAK